MGPKVMVWGLGSLGLGLGVREFMGFVGAKGFKIAVFRIC